MHLAFFEKNSFQRKIHRRTLKNRRSDRDPGGREEKLSLHLQTLEIVNEFITFFFIVCVYWINVGKKDFYSQKKTTQQNKLLSHLAF